MTRHFIPTEEFQWLKQAYFDDPTRVIQLEEDEVLLTQGAPNDRLFLVLKGVLCAYLDGQHGQFELFRAPKDSFVGVSSFFSHHPYSYTTLIASEKTTIAYIDEHQQRVVDPQDRSFVEQFMPVVMASLLERQYLMQRTAVDKFKAMRRLLQQEKMAMLGELSAGIAHELNNAISVISRRADWLSEEVQEHIQMTASTQASSLFQRGLSQGRNFTSEDLRHRRRQLETSHKLPSQQARKWAETGLSTEDVGRALHTPHAETLPTFWEWGAAFHDLHVASQHSAHVVQAIKQLGVPNRQADDVASVAETIHEALVLLQNQIRHVEVVQKIEVTSALKAHRGDLIQVWLNLLKNACESMFEANTPAPRLSIHAFDTKGGVEISITDNGPGIPDALIHRIFAPHFTTKNTGSSVSLGLGLAIVRQIVEHLDGEIDVESQPGKTRFTVQLPTTT